MHLRQVLREYDGLEQFLMRLTLIQVHLDRFVHVLSLFLHDNGQLKKLRGVRPQVRIHLKQQLDYLPQIVRVGLGYARDLTGADSLEQAFHAVGLEWRLQGDHLVQHAAERPYVTLDVVRLVTPDLW